MSYANAKRAPAMMASRSLPISAMCVAALPRAIVRPAPEAPPREGFAQRLRDWLGLGA